jgi:hypothetical protein
MVLKELKSIAYETFYPLFNPCKKVVDNAESVAPNQGMLKTLASATATLVAATLSHELLHLFGEYAASGKHGTIDFSPYYGGHLFEKIVPSLCRENKCSVLENIVNGGHYHETYGQSPLVSATSDLAPLVLVPIGIYLMNKGIKGKNPYLTGAGFIFSSQAVGACVDSLLAAFHLVRYAGESLNGLWNYGSETLCTLTDKANHGDATSLAILGIGGLVILNAMYRASEKLVSRNPKDLKNSPKPLTA